MKLVKVSYFDHVAFRHVEPPRGPMLREAVGWLVGEDEWALFLVCDRPVNRPASPHDLKACGLVLVKTAVLKVEELGDF